MLMHLVGAVVFWTLIITFVVKLVSELLNLKAADAGLPDEFVGLFDEAAYRKSGDYLRTLWELLAQLDRASLAAKRKLTLPFLKQFLIPLTHD